MHRDRGWRKIGYHHVIEVDGARKAGRPEAEIGAHVAGSNADSIGVVMVGTARFSPAQWEELAALAREIDARYPGIVWWGHRDYSPDMNGDGIIEPREWFKLCPGFSVSEWRMSGMDPAWNEAHILR